MIVLTGRDTCKPAYVDPNHIVKIQEKTEEIDGRAYPFSRIFLKDEKQKHEFFLDVVESKARIRKLVTDAENKPDIPKKGGNQTHEPNE